MRASYRKSRSDPRAWVMEIHNGSYRPEHSRRVIAGTLERIGIKREWVWCPSVHFLRKGCPAWDAGERIRFDTLAELKQELSNQLYVACVGVLDMPDNPHADQY